MKFIAGSAGDRFGLAICEALGIAPDDVRRIVIDLEAGHAARVYYETFADDEKLAVAFEGGIKLVGTEAEVKGQDAKADDTDVTMFTRAGAASFSYRSQL